MASTPISSDLDDTAFDPAHPFHGIVVCCTSIAPEQRSDLASKTHELGGSHKYDLTPDVTHLIVGEYDTPKYRHVAKERPDIMPMAAGWIQAVRDLWTKDAPIKFKELEKAWRLKTFETDGNLHSSSVASINDRGRLLICLTGFDDAQERQEITETVTANGGEYTGDLTRKVTHLVVNRPEGRKYAAAKTWGIHTVSIEWIRDSVERGMILDELRYDPLLPPRERGVGAWNRLQAKRAALGKRPREGSSAAGAADAADDRKRKLRRTASQKLATQRAGLWGDILGEQQGQQQAPTAEPAGQPKRESSADAASSRSVSRQGSTVANQPPGGKNTPSTVAGQATQATQEAPKAPEPSRLNLAADSPAFHSCVFHIHGFSSRHAEILVNTVLSLGGQTVSTLDELAAAQAVGPSAHGILIVPQESQPETHPQLPTGVEMVTEFFIEQCMHKRRFCPPSEHVIGRPFPRFPIVGFETLGISTSGFTGPDLNQVDKAIRQLGARYDERFTPKASLLVCTSVEAIRKQKLEMALAWKVPVVKAEWLWECISTGFKVPFRDFLFPELKQSLTPPETQVATSGTGLSRERLSERLSREEMMSAPAPASVSTSSSDLRRRQGQKATINPIDTSAFDNEGIEAAGPGPRTTLPARTAKAKDSVQTTTHGTVTTRQDQQDSDSGAVTAARSRDNSAPLSQVGSNALNKSTSPKTHDEQPLAPDEPSKPLTTAHARKGLGRILSEVADSEAPDSSREQTPEVESEPQRAESRKPRDARPLKPDVQHSMSNQLASLLDGTATTTGLGAEGDGGSSSGNARRRKRGIFGRAVSNVSAGSDGSGSVHGGLGSGPRDSLVPVVREDDEDDKEAERPPPSTELVYDAPQSEYFRALLRTGGASGTVSDGGDGEKLTLKDLQQHQQAAAAMGTRGASSSRRLRHR
ncbi:hypothetical protein RB597_004338 [Gaeumannomyces tritici]